MVNAVLAATTGQKEDIVISLGTFFLRFLFINVKQYLRGIYVTVTGYIYHRLLSLTTITSCLSCIASPISSEECETDKRLA